ncbi:MAG: argininosuccinate lyase, partial [Spirochaetota bacterium]
HTGRSRNDQVALDIRLYLRDEIAVITDLLKKLISLLADSAEKNLDVIMPGYTHMQIAQPVRLSQHLLAHAWALVRDLRRYEFACESASLCPLGVGALAGVNYANDRNFLAEKLEFSGVTPNSMDTTADRDFALDFLYASSVMGMHLSRFCEELVLWSTAEFGFIKLSDRVTTGSSIMPQKRNPDLAELIRGKSGRLYGNLITLLTIMKGLPMTYNRDLQEDKEPLFDSIDTVKISLEGMIEMLKDVVYNADTLRRAVYRNYSTATDLADYLVKKGVPFRKSHEIAGNVVRHCEKTGADFFTLPVETLRGFEPLIAEDVRDVLDPSSSTERKLSQGSTAKNEVIIQIKNIRAKLAE